jgi:hypothetical protein
MNQVKFPFKICQHDPSTTVSLARLNNTRPVPYSSCSAGIPLPPGLAGSRPPAVLGFQMLAAKNGHRFLLRRRTLQRGDLRLQFHALRLRRNAPQFNLELSVYRVINSRIHRDRRKCFKRGAETAADTCTATHGVGQEGHGNVDETE